MKRISLFLIGLSLVASSFGFSAKQVNGATSNPTAETDGYEFVYKAGVQKHNLNYNKFDGVSYLIPKVSANEDSPTGKALTLTYKYTPDVEPEATLLFKSELERCEGYAIWGDFSGLPGTYVAGLSIISKDNVWHPLNTSSRIKFLDDDTKHITDFKTRWRALDVPEAFKGWIIMPKSCFSAVEPNFATGLFVLFQHGTDFFTANASFKIGCIAAYTNLDGFLAKFGKEDTAKTTLDQKIAKYSALTPSSAYQEEKKAELLNLSRMIKYQFEHGSEEERGPIINSLKERADKIYQDYLYHDLGTLQGAFIFGSDAHMVEGTTTYPCLEDIKKEVPEADTIVHTGDCCDRGAADIGGGNSQLSHYFDVVDKTGYNIYNVLGNHEVSGYRYGGYAIDLKDKFNSIDEAYDAALDIYTKRDKGSVSAGGKKYFTVDLCGVKTLMLNPDKDPFHSSIGPAGHPGYVDSEWSHNYLQLNYFYASSEQLAFIEEQLIAAGDETVFICMHQFPDLVVSDPAYGKRFQDIIAEHPQAIVLSGHNHAAFGVNPTLTEGYGNYINGPSIGMGYQYFAVYVYDKNIVLRARNAAGNSWDDEHTIVIKRAPLNATFLDVNGNTLLTKKLVQGSDLTKFVPATEYGDSLIGWDLDGDGFAEEVPTSLQTDVTCKAVVSSASKVTFKFLKPDGSVYKAGQVNAGEEISLPADQNAKINYIITNSDDFDSAAGTPPSLTEELHYVGDYREFIGYDIDDDGIVDTLPSKIKIFEPLTAKAIFANNKDSSIIDCSNESLVTLVDGGSGTISKVESSYPYSNALSIEGLNGEVKMGLKSTDNNLANLGIYVETEKATSLSFKFKNGNKDRTVSGQATLFDVTGKVSTLSFSSSKLNLSEAFKGWIFISSTNLNAYVTLSSSSSLSIGAVNENIKLGAVVDIADVYEFINRNKKEILTANGNINTFTYTYMKNGSVYFTATYAEGDLVFSPVEMGDTTVIGIEPNERAEADRVVQLTLPSYTYQFVYGSSILSSGTVLDGEKITSPTNLSFQDGNFLITVSGFEGFDPNEAIHENKVYRAIFTKELNKITYKFVSDGATVKEETVDLGVGFEGMAPSVTKEGFNFVEWSVDESQKESSGVVTLTAVWQENGTPASSNYESSIVSSSQTENPSSSEEPSKGGCGGEIIASAFVCSIALLGVATLIKSRKED